MTQHEKPEFQTGITDVSVHALHFVINIERTITDRDGVTCVFQRVAKR